VLAFFWDLIPKGGWGFWPELTLAVLTFWAMRDPDRVGVGTAFVLGVMLDVGRGVALGQEALALVWVVYLAQRRSARILWFGGWGQALLLLPLWVLALAVQAAVRLGRGGRLAGMGVFRLGLCQCRLVAAPELRPAMAAMAGGALGRFGVFVLRRA